VPTMPMCCRVRCPICGKLAAMKASVSRLVLPRS
jgi:hypothetical protein